VLKIQLLYETGLEESVVNHVKFVLQNSFNAQLVSVEEVVIPDTFYNTMRGQYIADLVVEHISNFLNEDAYLLLLSTRDAYVAGLNFVFGLAIPWIRTAAVFLARLMLGATKTLLLNRVEKEVLHELGHLLGLKHCKTPGCVMNFSNSLMDVDRKSNKFCRKCYTKLSKSGVEVSSNYILQIL